MSGELSILRVRTWVRSLTALVAERARRESEVKKQHRTETDACEREYSRSRDELEARHLTTVEDTETEYHAEQARLKEQFTRQQQTTRRARDVEREKIIEKGQHSESIARRQQEEAIWAAETVYEAKEGQPDKVYHQRCKTLKATLGALEGTERQAQAVMQRARQKPPAPAPVETDQDDRSLEEAQQALEDHAVAARARLEELQGMFLLRLFPDIIPFVLVILPPAAVVVTVGLTRGWQPDTSMLGGAGGALALAIGVMIWLYLVARSSARGVYAFLNERLLRGRLAHEQARAQADERRQQEQIELVTTRDTEIRQANEKYEPILAEIDHRREHHLNRIREKYPVLLKQLHHRREHDLRENRRRYEAASTAEKKAYEQKRRDLESSHEERTRANKTRHETEWSDLQTRWKEGVGRARDEAEAINAESTRLFPPWTDAAWEGWAPGDTFAPAIQFGGVELDMEKLPGGLSSDPRLDVGGPTRFALPAVLALPDQCSLLLKSGDTGRAEAVQTLQTIMMRVLTAVPPGKARFTIIDPIGLGQNFAGFMHLADYNEAFVGGKIWTETRHIEQRLADLTEHMENVIQKYLRNEYATIALYNDEAGEIAEPYRFVVVCDFPTNFSDAAARRLTSILSSGARCGVYALMGMDTRMDLPRGMALADIERNCVTLAHKQGRFIWKDPDFEMLPLTLDPPPPESFVTRKLHLVGDAALDSTRVEVPFEVVAPPTDEWWSGDATTDVRVPLGRAGATRLQYLTLGKGTNQHALIAGKTGSGKSTMLHVLITNLALWYGPDQVEFYLVDFKKGVEFKTYAAHDLPHARAVAIESDREFGLSVLHRLDQELKRRGNLFRQLGVQDLAGHHRATDGKPLPRTLLIIDEFQEFFVEDDKIGQDAALLLDRLVRQGRAFGIHVLLGSQTLGGAYTLARSTIGQMGVRIALQCSETDSYLILSDDNAAARLLSRPGEAIYNDANGQVEGNSPFQVVWLPEPTRERYLQRMGELARERNHQAPEPRIVFEGNVPADPAANLELADHLREPAWPPAPTAPRTWLGEPVAIKGPTHVALSRQSGGNLIIVGQRDESALAMMAMTALSLGTQCPPTGGQLWILDGTPADSPHAGYLGRLSDDLPHQVRIVAWREVAEAMMQLEAELKRRTEAGDTDAPGVFVLINGLQRFRMLRRSEEDFGFSMGDAEKPPAADRQLAELLREGPPYGMHAVIWCDTATNVERCLERQGMREFDNRVLFQMSGPDSTTLIDTTTASKLGLHRALLFNEERGTLEKFRPYALPPRHWLAEVMQCLAGRSAGDPSIGGLPRISDLLRGERTPEDD
ncbi:MAG: FtsK/SpoIIIE domain-containing protein [Planctomycetota bacterium]